MNLSSWLARVGVAALLGSGAGCGDRPRARVADGETLPDSMGAAPASIASAAVRTRRNLGESSALAMSVRQPGVLFTIDDSGNDPLLFALDTAGADRGAWRVDRASNVDWEALAVGRCAGAGSTWCIYIGDVGDNDAHHPTRTIYRVPEPDAKDSAFTGSTTAARLVFTYPDGRHDVEAMYLGAGGDLFLITKRPLLDAASRPRPALVFRLPARAWRSAAPVVADLVDSLSIVPGSAPLRIVTDASLSPDGRRLAVRTYSQLFVYAVDSATGMPRAGAPPAICNLTALGEAQGEGVAWVSASGRFALSSEGPASPIRLATCPVPP